VSHFNLGDVGEAGLLRDGLQTAQARAESGMAQSSSGPVNNQAIESNERWPLSRKEQKINAGNIIAKAKAIEHAKSRMFRP